MEKKRVRAWIERVGIVPVIRAASPEQALAAAEAVRAGGISVVEVTMTVPGALGAIERLASRQDGELLVGAGTVLDAAAARQCRDAGAQFLVSPGFDAAVVQLARESDLLMIAGALTPTEIIAAWRAGADFVKVFPCGAVGGASYIKSLKGPLPQIDLIPTGGVNLKTAADYIRAGAAALGVGSELIPAAALAGGDAAAITARAAEFVAAVRQAREAAAAGGGH